MNGTGGRAASGEVGYEYATAHAAHYRTKDLTEALDLYTGIMAGHPDSQEAQYSRTQIQNIVRQLIPRQELLDSQVALARAHLDPHHPATVR